jgi:hypothetical protein
MTNFGNEITFIPEIGGFAPWRVSSPVVSELKALAGI